MSYKKIALFFDGTWNTPDDTSDDGDPNTETNVPIMHRCVLPRDENGVIQKAWYTSGVGTKWYDRIRGGAFGSGLSDKIKEGYEYLSQNYDDGDKVYIFGFSRGAYTARSLVGLIRNSGLLKKDTISELDYAYELYRTKDAGADSENAKFFRSKFSRMIEIECLGVWDTVGALGIPLNSFEWFNKERYEFHDTELSGIVRNAFHAVAIDEHRKDYDATMWDPKTKPNQRIEQMWFCGAHSNVGGGYLNDSLPYEPLKWMIERAKSCGLALDAAPEPDQSVVKSITDSYSEFLGGIYKWLNNRYYRKIGTTAFGGESIDISVQDFCMQNPEYKPKNHVGESLSGNFKPSGRIHC